MLFEYLVDGLQGVIQLLLGVCSHQREANQGVFRSDCRRNYRIDEDTCLKQFLYNEEGQIVVANEQGDDRSGSMADLTAHLAEAIQCVVGQIPQVLDTLRLIHHNVQRSVSGSRSGWRIAGTEDIGTGMMAQIIDDRLVCGDETTDRSE